MAKRSSPRSRNGIEGDDLGVALARLGELVQHARRIRPDVLTEKEDAVGVLEIIEHVTVPTGTPIDSGSATDVDSWHMFDESGKLLVP